MSCASGALLIFTVKSTLNYTRVLRSSTEKKKKGRRSKQLDPDQTPLYATSDQDVHGLGINLSNLGPTNRVDQNKKEEAFFYHSQLNRRLIFWTRRLHLVFCSLSAFTRVTQTDLLSDYRY